MLNAPTHLLTRSPAQPFKRLNPLVLLLLLASLLFGMNVAKAQLTVDLGATELDATPLVGTPPVIYNTDNFIVTLTFREDVSGLSTELEDEVTIEGYFAVTGGVALANTFTKTDDRNYQVQIEPNGATVIMITFSAVVSTGDANNVTATGTLVVNFINDTTPPTVMFEDVPANHNGSSEFMVTVILSEIAPDFVVGDVTVSPSHNPSTGTAPTLRAIPGSDTTYTLTITPDHTSDIMISIPAESFTDANSNGNTASVTLTVSYVDTTPPTVMFEDVPANHNGSAFMVTVILSEIAPDFVVGDVTVSPSHNPSTGTAPTLLAIPGSDTTYTLTITPDHTSDIMISIPAESFTDANSNGNTASVTLTVSYVDTTPPTVMFEDVPANHNGSAFMVTVILSEIAPDFVVGDVTVSPSHNPSTGTAPTLRAIPGSDTTYTLTITPDHTSDIMISIPAESFTDANSNGNTASVTLTVSYVDTTPPTVMFEDVPANHNGSAFMVTVILSEIAPDFVVGDVTVSPSHNPSTGTAPTLLAIPGSDTTYTLTITPDHTSDIMISIPAESFTDANSNGNTASVTLTVSYVDTTPPTVMFEDVPANHNGSAFMVTVILSEIAPDFVVGDVTVSPSHNPSTGTAPTLRAIPGSDTTYTLTITPDDTSDIMISIPAESFRDPGRNLNTAPTPLDIPYLAPPDITDPIATLTGPAYFSDTINAFTVNLQFSEDVELLETSAEMLETIREYFSFSEPGRGMILTLDYVDDSNYTVRVLPTGTGDIRLRFVEGSAIDAAENFNPDSNILLVTYDSVAPMVTLSGAPETVNSQAPFEVTLTFTEAVTGLEEAEIEVTNDAATRLSGSGANYVLTITPDGMGDIEITIPAEVAVDVAGNNNTASNLVRVTYVADAIAPMVTLAGPDTLSNLEPFAVTATFSEVVTGLEVADIEVTNGAVTTLSGSGAVYVLTMTPTGNGDLSITIPAAAAVDAAANGNTASNTLAVVNTLVADTQAAITGFMLARANNLARNQPGLTRFLQGTGCGSSLSANNTGTAHGCVSRGQTWGELSNLRSSDSSYTLVTLGAHRFVRDSLIIGGLVQLDAVDDDARNITGHGWLAGPYFVSKPADQNMVLEGRLLYGQTDNDISPLGSYEDSFETDRYLAQLRVTGQYSYQMVTLMPLLDFTYTEDMQQDYTDTLNNLINEQGIDLTQVTFGMDFRLPVAVQMGQLDLTGGLSGTYSEVNGGAADFERGRGRVELGLNYASDNGTTLAGGIFYDGISSDHESYGVNLSFDMKF